MELISAGTHDFTRAACLIRRDELFDILSYQVLLLTYVLSKDLSSTMAIDRIVSLTNECFEEER